MYFVFNKFFPEDLAVYEITWKKGHSQTGNKWQRNTGHVHCMLGNLGKNVEAKAPQCYFYTDITGFFLLLSVYYYYY